MPILKEIPKGQKILEENLRNQYMNEYTNSDDYRNLTKNEKVDLFAEYALNEFVNTAGIVDALFHNKGNVDEQFGKIEGSLKNNKYFRDIDNSLGDITRTKNNQNLKNILEYALHANYHNSYSSDGTDKFNYAARDILKCIDNFERAKNRLKSIITKESTRMNSRRIGAAFYRTSVFLVQMTGDILYSNSLKARFDYNLRPPVAKDIHYEYDSEVVDDMLAFIQYLNSAFANGRIFTALEDTLQEALEIASQKVSLQEGVLDTIFGLVTYFKSLDLLLLWPIYLTRAVTYWITYLFVSVNNIALDIDSSIAIQRSTTLTKEQYDDYASKAAVRGTKVSQAFSKASVALDMSAKEDRKALENLQSGSVMI